MVGNTTTDDTNFFVDTGNILPEMIPPILWASPCTIYLKHKQKHKNV